MSNILVTYATRAGSTTGVAEAIGKVFTEAGATVDVLPMHDVQDISTYDAVIAGSAINGNQWLPEALRFMEIHRADLSKKPFAAFMVCITLSMKDADKYRESIKDWMAPVRALVPPVSEGYFAGALDFNKLAKNRETFMLRIPVFMRIWKEGDHREWDKVQAWAREVAPLLNVA